MRSVQESEVDASTSRERYYVAAIFISLEYKWNMCPKRYGFFMWMTTPISGI
jgi:hypothetical protein